MKRLKRRQDFVAAAKAFSWGTPAFMMQLRQRSDDGPARLGFTCTKKLGNAVARNRIKRRLREASRLALPAFAQISCDYVIIGRSAAETRAFDILQSDLISALQRLHAKSNQVAEQPMELK